MRMPLIAALAALVVGPALRADSVVRREHAVVSFDGVSEEQATAVARVVQSARKAAADLGFDMPRTIDVSISVRPTGGAGLFNDGDQNIFLTVRSERDLRRPAASGVFLVYGLSHEVGHLAMYRAVRAGISEGPRFESGFWEMRADFTQKVGGVVTQTGRLGRLARRR